MKTYAPQWKTLNTSWPEDDSTIDVVYESDDKDGAVLRNVFFCVNRHGDASFTYRGVELDDTYITGWHYTDPQ